jgi:PAS domain S-box-containing protein
LPDAILAALKHHLRLGLLPPLVAFTALGALIGTALSRRRLREQIAAVRESEQRLRLLVSGVKDYAILMLDREGRVVSWNSGGEKIKGYKAEEIIGRHFSIFYTEEDLKQGKPAHELKVAMAEGQYEEEGWRVRKDGSRFWALVLITALYDRHGQLHGFGKVTRDITERKRATDEIRRLNVDLELGNLELMAANKELEAFTYTAAHDLRAPLRHIHGFASSFRAAWYDKLDDEGRHFLDKITASAKHMGALLDDLLNFSRLGRTELQVRRVSLNDVIGRVRSELAPDLVGRTVTWDVQDLPNVDGDPSLLHQAFFNLVANAVKYSRKVDHPHITIKSTHGTDGNDTVIIRDNGVGFDMQYVDKLFRVFQRLHTPSDFEGTGIGLAIVQRIVERHKGSVRAESTLNQGATFYVSLPACLESHDEQWATGKILL